MIEMMSDKVAQKELRQREYRDTYSRNELFHFTLEAEPLELNGHKLVCSHHWGARLHKQGWWWYVHWR